MAFGTRRPDSTPINPAKEPPVKPFDQRTDAKPASGQPPATNAPGGAGAKRPAESAGPRPQSLEERLKAQPIGQRQESAKPKPPGADSQVPLTSTLSSIRKQPEDKKATGPEDKAGSAEKAAGSEPPKKAGAKGPGRAAILGMLFITVVVVVGAIFARDSLRGPDAPQPTESAAQSEPETTAAGDGDQPAQSESDTATAPENANDAAIPAAPSDASAAPDAEQPQANAEGSDQLAAVPPPPAVDALTADESLELEQLLAQLDMSPGAVDGTIDGDTEQAIRLYQEFAGLPIDGVASQALLLDLRDVARMVPSSSQ